MVVVGFDVGNGNCVIAVVKHRGVDVLLNDESHRENPAVVSFGEKQRFVGTADATTATMNPRSTVSRVKRLVGLNLSHPESQNELRRLPFSTSASPDGGVLVHLHYLGETRTFTPVQIMAMLFSHLKQIAEKSLGEPVSDCVIGIPSYFTDLQRRGYLDAAAISGLRPLRLLHDCTATTLGYGIYTAESPIGAANYVVFVDIGHCDTQDLKALVDACVDEEMVHSVELGGSGSRIPAITKMLAALFRREPCRTKNASECVARGCALQGAMLSPIYRVKEYEVQDSLPYSIGISTDEGPISTLSNNVLFPKGQALPIVKILTFYRSNMFRLDAFYVDPNELPVGTSSKISSFMIGPFQVSHPCKSKIKVRVQLNLHDIVVVESAVLIEDEQPKVSSREEPETVSRSSMVGSIEENGFDPQSESLLNASIITEGQRSSGVHDAVLVLQETQEWLYDDGDDESENVYMYRLEELKKLVEPIEIRFKDNETRPQATRDLLKRIVDYKFAAKSLADPEREAVLNECSKAEQWLQEKTLLQDAMPKNCDPVLSSMEIRNALENLERACKCIVKPRGSKRHGDGRGVAYHAKTDSIWTD